MWQTSREAYWLVPAILLALIFSMGDRISIFWDAKDMAAMRSGVQERLLHVEATTGCEEREPHFTVMVGLNEYSVKLSLSLAGVHAMFEDEQMRWSDQLSICSRSVT